MVPEEELELLDELEDEELLEDELELLLELDEELLLDPEELLELPITPLVDELLELEDELELEELLLELDVELEDELLEVSGVRKDHKYAAISSAHSSLHCAGLVCGMVSAMY
jgi:hypothetical protein